MAVEHLATYLEGVRLDRPSSSIDTQGDTVEFNSMLEQTNQKLRLAYSTVKSDPHFNSEMFRQSTAGLEKFINKGNDADNTQAKTRPPSNLQNDDSSGNEFDEDMDESVNEKIKQRFQAAKTEKLPVSRNFRKYKV